MTFFIDRPETDKLLSKLRAGLKDPASNPLVLHSWGIGGVGKTTLLAKIVEQHPEAAIAQVSFGLTSDIETPIKLMKKLHEQLYPNLSDWEDNEDEFTSRYNEYQITLSKLEKDKDAKEFGKILQSSAQGILVTEKVASEVAKQGFQALMESTGVTDKLNAWLNRSSVTKGNVELQQLIKEPLPILTKAFAASLRAKATTQKPVLLLFDTYEKILPDNDRWLWHWLLANNQLQDLAVRLVITGRNEILKQEGWRKLQQDREFIYTKGVERFDFDRTKAYLWNIGIRQEDYFDQIYQITKGWPYYLNIIRERLADGQDIESILEQIDRGIEELLLQESDVDKKRLMSQVSRTAACCQSFDQRLINYLLAKLELSPTVDGVACYDWLAAQHFFEQKQSRLDDVARDVFRKSLWREDRELFTQVHGWLADYFNTKADRYASPDSSYVDKYENDDWVTARSEYLYHRLFVDRVDTQEFIGYLLESRYFRENKLVQFPLQGILVESDLDKHPFLSAQGRQFLIKVKPAIVNPWAVLEESPIDYDYNLLQWNLSRSKIDEAISTCLDTNEQTTGLAKFMWLYCKSKRSPEAEQFDWLMRSKEQVEQFEIGREPRFICDLLCNKIADSLCKLEMYEEAIRSYDQVLEVQPNYHEAFVNKGYVLGNLGRLEEAIKLCDQALKINPDDYTALSNKGVALRRLGRFEEAIAAYDQALVIKPDHHQSFYNKGVALANLGRFEEAIAASDQALVIKPDDHQAFYNKGVALASLGRFEEAISAYDQALVIKPDDHEAFVNKGVALANLGRFEEAIAASDQALVIKPDDHQAFVNKGVALANLGRFEEAIAAYDQALVIKPDDHQAFSNKGFALASLGRFEEAIAAYDQALVIKPDDHEAFYNKGFALASLDRFEEAIAAYDQALVIKPDDHQAFYNKGVALANLDRFEEAIAAYDQALVIKPDDHQAFYNKGVALANLDRFEEAIAAYDQALVIKPDDHQAFYNKGVALANLDRFEEAIAAFDQALAIKPDLHQAFSNKGFALASLGRFEQAIAAYDQALVIKPDDHEAFVNKGVALANLGRFEEAIAAYDQALVIKPDDHQAFYNKSCSFALSGEIDLAITSLHTAINLDPQCRELAKTDTDFDPIRDDARFQQLIAEPNAQT